MGTPRWRCDVDGCGRPAVGRGLCAMHYMRERRGGGGRRERDPQQFVQERQELMRVNKGTGTSGGDRRKKLTPEQRGAISRASNTEEAGEESVPQERVVKMPELRFLQNRFGWEPK